MEENSVQKNVLAKVLIISFFVVAFLVICGYLFLRFGNSSGLRNYFNFFSTEKVKTQTEGEVLKENIANSLTNNQPEKLQNFFIQKVAKNEKDNLSKAAIYFITHRYFDNGGNIQEIVDYVNNNPEVVFLKDARNIYPEIFKKIETRTKLTKKEGLLAYLAYLEILKNQGYADAASFGTAASRYAEQYHLGRLAKKPETDIEIYKSKSVIFSTESKKIIEGYMEGTYTMGENYSKDDMLVGLNQYALTLALYKADNIAFESKYTYKEVFDFALNYAVTNNLLLIGFTALNYDYALLIAGDLNEESAQKVGLGYLLKKLYKSTTYKPNSLTDKMVNGTKRGSNVNGVYGTNTINKIMESDPEFKTFMLERGYKTK